MTKFLKLTLDGSDKRIMVNIEHVDCIAEQLDNGTCQIWYQGDSVNPTYVNESFDQIEAMIRNEEVVK